MKPDEFIQRLLPAALACQKETGIPASFNLTQAALESGWGKSELANRGRNLFGVKADKSWTGPVVMMLTGEHLGGKDVTVQARWRVYATYQECFDDHAKFFRENPRYSKCWGETTGEGWARAVAAAGYATDPKYAWKLIQTMRARKLAQYDNKEKS